MQPSTTSSSSLSIPRSTSSLSIHRDHRPPSSLSTRPHSRLSIRHARNSRLLPLCQTLVTQVTGLEESRDGGIRFKAVVASAMTSLESNKAAAASVDIGVVDQQIRGHALKARINSRDQLSEALETCFKRLQTKVEAAHDLDQEIKMSRLPDHLQFLLSLSTAPSALTLQHASSYLQERANIPPPPAPLTWAAILAEEPFEGEHWEGVYGLPPEYVRRAGANEDERHKNKAGLYDGHDRDGHWSTPSLSPLHSGDLALDEDSDDDVGDITSDPAKEKDGSLFRPVEGGRAYTHPPHTYTHRKEFEALQEKQYWREGWKGDGTVAKTVFSMGDASTLGPALRTILRPPGEKTRSASVNLDFLVQREKYINEEDAVREVLMALQGRKNIMLEWRDDQNGEGIYALSKTAPSLRHLSLASQASIFSSLARSATTLQRLRQFVTRVFEQTQARYTPQTQHRGGKNNKPTRTLEAFADAVDAQVRALDSWCAAKEEAMCRAWGGAGTFDANGDMQPLVISLLGTEKDIQDAFDSTFEVLLDVQCEVYPSAVSDAARNKSAALLSTMLLDRLFEKIQRHLERQEEVTSEALMRVFVRTAEPMWAMIGKWLRDGMGLGMGVGMGISGGAEELEDEFFIESSGLGLGMVGMGLLDPEFWREGYALREGVVFDGEDGERRRKTIPQFLEHVAELVLGAGKAVGLLRALGVPPSSSPSSEWQTFGKLVGLSPTSASLSPPEQPDSERGNTGDELFSVSIDTLSRLIYDKLLPQCEVAGATLAQVLVDECALWTHLASIEDLFLMRRGDAISHFVDVLFAKMDAQQSWSDFHFLNTAFRDIVEASTNAGAKEWVQTSLVRLSYRGTKDKGQTILGTVKAIDGLLVEYAVPFPLTYIFQPATVRVYAEIFTFLLQIRRAKSVLERVLVRGEARGKTLRAELKVFYAMRSRLSWFINVLLNFLTTYVIHVQVLRFHEVFRTAKSLDEMIRLHDEHLDKIQGRCLLKPNTSALYRAILSILDMALHFTDFFVTFAGDTTLTHDVSRQSISIRGHRSRRQRRQRKNIIGFVQSLQDSLDSSEDEDDSDVDGKEAPEPSFTSSVSLSYAEENFSARMEKISSELDGLVRFLRRGVESLAGGGSEAAPAFGVLAFALEDWDN